MRPLLANRIELVEAYVRLRGPRAAPEILDAWLAEAYHTTLPWALRAFLGGSVELLLTLEDTGPTFKAAIMTPSLAPFVNGRHLETAAYDLIGHSKRFARGVIGAFCELTQATAARVDRREIRLKAPGKIVAIFDTIDAGVAIGATEQSRLKPAEHRLLLDELAGLCRTVHNDKAVAGLLKRIKRATGVDFLPETKAELGRIWEKKMVGVKQEERAFRRRQAVPSFAAASGPRVTAALVRTRIGAGGDAGPPAYFSA